MFPDTFLCFDSSPSCLVLPSVSNSSSLLSWEALHFLTRTRSADTGSPDHPPGAAFFPSSPCSGLPFPPSPKRKDSCASALWLVTVCLQVAWLLNNSEVSLTLPAQDSNASLPKPVGGSPRRSVCEISPARAGVLCGHGPWGSGFWSC